MLQPNEQETSCCLCGCSFTTLSQPRMMPFCEHNSCTACLKQLLSIQKTAITCRHCGHQQPCLQSDLQCFPKNMSLAKYLREKSATTCSMSQEESSQESVVERQESVVERRESVVREVCQVHRKELELICLNDREMVCPHCALFGSHKDHLFKTVPEAHLLMQQRRDQFGEYRSRKQQLQARLGSAEFKEGVVRKIGEQKDRLVLDIKRKFAAVYENVRLAEKKAFEDVVKNFKAVYHRITALIREENDSQRKYKQWEQKCAELFARADGCRGIEEQMGYYVGPLELCGEGDALLKRMETKVDSNIAAIEGLIAQIKVVDNPAVANSLFNYLTVHLEDTDQNDSFGHVPQETLSPRQLKSEGHSRTRVEFSPDPYTSDAPPTTPNTPRKRSPSHEKEKSSRAAQKRSSGKGGIEVERVSAEKRVQEFCERDNLDTLDLTGYSLCDAQILQILRYLKSVKRIKGLKLIKNKLTNEGLGRMLELIPQVTNLNLSFNQLSDDALLQLLANRPKVGMLRIINLSNNRINERKAKAAIDELKKQGLIVTI